MRIAAIALVNSAAIGAANAEAANPYEVFRLGMTAAEVETAAEAHDGKAVDVTRRAADRGTVEWTPAPTQRQYQVSFPMVDRALGNFGFEHDRLQHIRLLYYFIVHLADPADWLTAAQCDEMFARITGEIETVYGEPAETTDKAEDSLRSRERFWSFRDAIIEAHMAAFSMRADDEPACGIVEVNVFAGTKAEFTTHLEHDVILLSPEGTAE